MLEFKTEPLTIEQLQQLAQEYIRLLRLEHWDIIVTITPQYAMPITKPALGCCWSDPDAYRARIHILPHAEIDPNSHPSVLDQELTLVHELLHVWTKAWKLSKTQRRNLEKMIEATARALVHQKRLLQTFSTETNRTQTPENTNDV